MKTRQFQLDKARQGFHKSAGSQPGEVENPAYTAINAGGDRLAARMLKILIGGVSTRHYASVITEMADTVGVSKSQVSRNTIKAGTEVLKVLSEKTFS